MSMKETDETLNVENVSWEDYILWDNKEEHKAVDSVDNYTNFLKYHPEFKDKFEKHGIRLFFKGKPFDNKNDINYIKKLTDACMQLSNKNTIKMAMLDIDKDAPVVEDASEEESWEYYISWEDKEAGKAVDDIENYINFLKYHPNFKGLFERRGIRLYFRGELFDNKIHIKFIADVMKKNMKISRKSSIECAMVEIAENAPVVESDNEEDYLKIAQQFKPDYDEVNKNIDNVDDDDLIKSVFAELEIHPTKKSQSQKEWDKYKEWKKTNARRKYNQKGEVTGYDDSHLSITEWLQHYPPLKGKITYNECTERIEINGLPKNSKTTSLCMNMMNTHFLNKYSNHMGFHKAIEAVAYMNSINPVQDYFKTLKYDDSKNWIRYLITDVLKCPNKEFWDFYEYELKIWLCAFVKRNLPQYYYTDIKFDNILVFASENGGTGKSSIIDQLFTFGGKRYSLNVPTKNIDFANKDTLQKMHTSACVNFDEVNVSSKFVTEFKTFVQNTRDSYRTPYAIDTEEHIRHFIFAASTNNNDILKDLTAKVSERRWWIIHVTEDVKNGVEVNRLFNDKELRLADKVWAQAIHCLEEEPDMPLWIELGGEQDRILGEIQSRYNASNQNDYIEIKNILDGEWGFYDNESTDVEAIVEQYLDGDAVEWCKRHNKQIKEFHLDDHHVVKADEKYITHFGHIDKINATIFHNILKKLNFKFMPKRVEHAIRDTWEKKSARINGKVCNAYVRKNLIEDRNKFIWEEHEKDNLFEGDYTTEDLPI